MLIVYRHFTFYYFVVNDSAEEQSSRMIVNFLKFKILNDEFLELLKDTFFQIEFIQRKFRNLRSIMAQRSYALRYSIMP